MTQLPQHSSSWPPAEGRTRVDGMVESKAMLCLLQRPNDKGQREIDTLYIITRRIQVRADTSGRRLESHRTAFRPRWGVSRPRRAHSSRCGHRAFTVRTSAMATGGWSGRCTVRVSISLRRRSGTSTGDPLDICTGR